MAHSATPPLLHGRKHTPHCRTAAPAYTPPPPTEQLPLPLPYATQHTRGGLQMNPKPCAGCRASLDQNPNPAHAAPLASVSPFQSTTYQHGLQNNITPETLLHYTPTHTSTSNPAAVLLLPSPPTPQPPGYRDNAGHIPSDLNPVTPHRTATPKPSLVWPYCCPALQLGCCTAPQASALQRSGAWHHSMRTPGSLWSCSRVFCESSAIKAPLRALP